MGGEFAPGRVRGNLLQIQRWTPKKRWKTTNNHLGKIYQTLFVIFVAIVFFKIHSHIIWRIYLQVTCLTEDEVQKFFNFLFSFRIFVLKKCPFMMFSIWFSKNFLCTPIFWMEIFRPNKNILDCKDFFEF